MYAQQRVSETIITVNGNKNLQLSLDGRDYAIISSNISGNKTTISISNLEIRQHTLVVTRTGKNSNRSERISTTFNLRNRFDMLVKVNGNGSLELIETKNNLQNDNYVAMNEANFNILLRNVRNQRSVNGKRIVIDNAFSVDNNYFTTSQVVQMLRLVNSESYRLQLSKSSYPRITDRNNFGQLNNLLNSQASRNELQDYVDNYDDVYDEENYTNVAMSDANFNALLKSTQQQWQANAKLNSLTDVFNSSNNYFTAYQARQLIMLVDAEDSRLGLAKISYRTIVDPTNFNQVANLLTSQASKDQLTVFINNYNNSGTTTIAMLESDFNTLYKTIEVSTSLISK